MSRINSWALLKEKGLSRQGGSRGKVITATRVPASSRRSNAGNTHIAGEMFVAAELAKRGYLVSLTMGNAKAVAAER
jgi:hypothetical protein